MSFDPPPVPTVPEFRVNATTGGNQYAPSVAALADGGFVVCWLSDDPATYDVNSYAERLDVHAQRYTAEGAAEGGEFRVNTATSGNQSNQAVAALADGGFVVFWMSNDPSTYDPDSFSQRSDIFGQRYAADGGALGGEFRVNAAAADRAYTPSVAALTDGGFIVSWHAYHDAGRDPDIFAQRYAADGAPVGREFRVNTIIADGQYTPSVAALADGGFVVSWASRDARGGSDIFAQRYAADGTAEGGEFVVNTTANGGQYGPAVAALADGGFVVSWDTRDADGDAGIHARRYAADGTAEGGAFVVDTPSFGDFGTAVAALADGGFVVSWNGFNSAGQLDISARRYAADGGALGGEFRVNAPSDASHAGPTVAGLADGGFVVSWGGQGSPGDTDVFARRYAADGTAWSGDDTAVAPNEVRIAPVAAAKAEGDSGPTAFAFTVSLDRASGVEQSVRWRVEKHGADPAKPKDFVGGGFPSGEVVFAPGETEKTITVGVAGDAAIEADETFAVSLRKPSDGLVIGGEGRATATILDDDLPASASPECAAKVARLYEAALDRLADRGGFEFWVGALQKGGALSSLASGFLASEEFAVRFGGASADHGAFVDRLYQNILGRAGEAEGGAFWAGSLEGGCSRAEVLAAFSESAEHVALTAARLEDGSGFLIA